MAKVRGWAHIEPQTALECEYVDAQKRVLRRAAVNAAHHLREYFPDDRAKFDDVMRTITETATDRMAHRVTWWVRLRQWMGA